MMPKNETDTRRQARLATALRDNLKRRKEQGRARKAGTSVSGGGDSHAPASVADRSVKHDGAHESAHDGAHESAHDGAQEGPYDIEALQTQGAGGQQPGKED